MNILIIGFGSIGKRHFEVLRNLNNLNSLEVVTKQDLADITSYKSIEEVQDLEKYDYFVIASETFRHYEQLKYICSKVKGKKILVEKPLYNKKYEKFTCENEVFTAYNLRFHPVLEKLHTLLKNEEVYYANIVCGQYLPTWRPEQDYTKSYSADISQGGGVLRDLSHELDYMVWLFGNIEKMEAINTKVSDLDINSDDICTAIAITESKVLINLSIDYISKDPMRRLIIHTKEHTIEADFIKNSIVLFDKESKMTNLDIELVDRSHTYSKMHTSIINNQHTQVCSYEEGLNIVNIIENIEFKEL